jgi:AraC-like DNA-binding protein
VKPRLLKVQTAAIHSFNVRLDRVKNLNNRWHYHPELELIHFHRGAGTQFVGDSIKRFEKEDIVLVGSNLPHFWRDDETSSPDVGEALPYSTVVHFSEHFWGTKFLDLPENKPIKQVIEKAKRGLFIVGRLRDHVALCLEKLRMASGPERIILLMEILSEISKSTELFELSSVGSSNSFSESENDRINAIYNHTLGNFKQKIPLEEIAGVAGMAPNSFCRYFKSRTGKTYSQFLTEIRIGHACKLLIDKDMSIKQLCFESGFLNFSCFHKRFRAMTGQSPQTYRTAFSKTRN